MKEVLIEILRLYAFTFLASNTVTLACLVRAIFDCKKKYNIAPYQKKAVIKFILNILFKKFKRTLIPVYNLMLTSLEWFNPDIIEVTLVDYLVSNGILISRFDYINNKDNANEKKEYETKTIPKRIISRIKKRVRTKNDDKK